MGLLPKSSTLRRCSTKSSTLPGCSWIVHYKSSIFGVLYGLSMDYHYGYLWIIIIIIWGTVWIYPYGLFVHYKSSKWIIIINHPRKVRSEVFPATDDPTPRAARSVRACFCWARRIRSSIQIRQR